MSTKRHQPPAQPIGNVKGRHVSKLATPRTVVPPKSPAVSVQFVSGPQTTVAGSSATEAGRGDGL